MFGGLRQQQDIFFFNILKGNTVDADSAELLSPYLRVEESKVIFRLTCLLSAKVLQRISCRVGIK